MQALFYKLWWSCPKARFSSGKHSQLQGIIRSMLRSINAAFLNEGMFCYWLVRFHIIQQGIAKRVNGFIGKVTIINHCRRIDLEYRFLWWVVIRYLNFAEYNLYNSNITISSVLPNVRRHQYHQHSSRNWFLGQLFCFPCTEPFQYRVKLLL